MTGNENIILDDSKLDKIAELLQIYKYNWGKEVDHNFIWLNISQEKLITILERIIETGESVIVGYDKCFGKR